jgi:hypothetical protein
LARVAKNTVLYYLSLVWSIMCKSPSLPTTAICKQSGENAKAKHGHWVRVQPRYVYHSPKQKYSPLMPFWLIFQCETGLCLKPLWGLVTWNLQCSGNKHLLAHDMILVERTYNWLAHPSSWEGTKAWSSRSLSMTSIDPSWYATINIFSEPGIHFIIDTAEELSRPYENAMWVSSVRFTPKYLPIPWPFPKQISAYPFVEPEILVSQWVKPNAIARWKSNNNIQVIISSRQKVYVMWGWTSFCKDDAWQWLLNARKR